MSPENSSGNDEDQLLDKIINICSHLITLSTLLVVSVILGAADYLLGINISDLILAFVLILLIISVVLKLYKAEKVTTENIQTLQDISNEIKFFKEVSLEILRSDNSIISSISKGRFISEKTLKDEQGIVFNAFESLKLDLREWRKNVNQFDDEKIQNLWLKYFSTYFREEAFDIKRKEIVTNGRNYPFLLIQTLLTLLNNLEEGKKVYFYSMTPIHPKDWYNWPHGWEKPRAHIEVDFMRLYRGLLQEIVNNESFKDKLELKRFVLSVDNRDLKPAFGWPLSFVDDKNDFLENWFILDIPGRKKDLENAGGKLQNLSYVYNKLFNTHHVDENQLIVPAYFAGNINDMNLSRGDDIYPFYKNLLNSKDITESDVKTYKNNATDYLFKTYIKYRNDILDSFKEFPNHDILSTQFKGYFPDKYSEFNSKSVTNVCEFLQEISIDLADKHPLVDELLYTFFRLINSKNVSGPTNLKDLWINSLHSDPENVQRIVLQKSNIDNWKEKKIPTSFVMFGIGEQEKETDWKLAILSDLNYPFNAAKIQLAFPNDPYNNKFEEIHEVIDSIENNNKSKGFFKTKELF